MAETTALLPRIFFSRKDAGEMSFIIEGQSRITTGSNTQCLDNGRKRFLPEEVKTRSLTARAYTANSRLWAPEHEKGKENMRAKTAGGRLSVDMAITQAYSVNEIISIIREKLTNSHTYIYQMFRNNDPKGQGTISREALTRVLWNICGFLTTQQINNLLSRLNLSRHSSISFEDFKNCFQSNKAHNTEWIKPTAAKHLQRNVSKQKGIEANMNNTCSDSDKDRMWKTLADRLKKKSLKKFLPPSCLQPPGVITFQQFTEALRRMGIEFSEDELANLWTRTGNNTSVALPTVLLLKKLGSTFQEIPKDQCIWDAHMRRCTGEIIIAIKQKIMFLVYDSFLNEACFLMLKEFSKMNSSQTNLTSRSEFRLVLQNFNIPMTAVDLEHLLARFNLRRKDGLVDYIAFVNKLKSRSRLSFMKKMLEETEERQKMDTGEPSGEGLSAMEAERQLFHLCQGPFIQLLVRFNKADILRNGNVSQEEFKEIIENTIQVQLTPAHIKSFVALLGNQKSNGISFINFIAFLQDRPTTSELKEEIAVLSSILTVHHRIDKIRYQKAFEMDLSRYTNAQSPRKLQEASTL
ncbi:EF-hand calcium-binding domain-containing protein 6-like [Lithobates pipiens]